MIRLFIALDFPEAVLDQLGEMARGLPGVRWTPRESLHLTLRFIGELDNEKFQDLREALDAVEFTEFSMRLEGVGRFGPRRAPGVLFAGVPENPELKELRRRVDRVLMEQGVKLEKRKFQPHVTLARPRHLSEERLREYMEHFQDFRTELFPVREFILFSSKLRAEGAVHKAECLYPAMTADENAGAP